VKDKRTEFSRDQTEYFQDADEQRFRWMTGDSFFASKEKELLESLNRRKAASVMEVGCGEGANLVNLAYRPHLAVGIDLFEDRCRFAQQHCPTARFVRADGYRLPVRGDSFDAVFCRDLLHHVLRKEDLVAEMVRVCRPNGHVVCVEACGRNPVVFCLAAAIRAERGLLHSSPARLQSLLKKVGLSDVCIDMYQPLPSYRVLLHHRYGLPSLGERRWFPRWANRADRLFARLIPRSLWAYAVVSGRKPA
jgi:ubiquinone/menaquinone biosynthesis C-methylase UbiE